MIFRRKDNPGFGSSSIGAWLLAPFRSVGRFFATVLQADDSINVQQSWGARIVAILTLPFRFCLGFLIFMIQAWTSSRPGYAFIRAIPAMAVMGGFFIALLAADYIHNESRRIGTNLSYFDYHITRSPEHPEYAEIFAEKLVMLQPESLNNRYELGRVLELGGETYRALDIMNSLAPEDHAGFVKAHIWLANYYIRLDAEEKENAHSDLVRKHLAYAIEVEPDNKFAHFTIANLDIAEIEKLEKGSPEYRAKLESAIEHLVTIVDAEFSREGIDLQLAVLPKLLELQIELGDEAGAKTRLKNQLDRLDLLAKRLPDAQAFEVRKVMVRSALSVKDYQQVMESILEAERVVKSQVAKQQFTMLSALIYLTRAGDYLDMSDRSQYDKRLEFLCEAVWRNPMDLSACKQILEFVAPENPTASPSDDSDRTNAVDPANPARLPTEVRLDWLRGIRTSPMNMGVVHVLLGISEISAGNVVEGEKHWRIAEKLNRNTQRVVNQLVQVAATTRADDFSNVLDMTSMGMELFPDEDLFYQTRGILLEDLGRYQEAVTDLTYASEKRPDLIFLHKHLIACYRQLGDDAKVIEQETQLQEKLNQMDARTRKRAEEEIAIRFPAE